MLSFSKKRLAIFKRIFNVVLACFILLQVLLKAFDTLPNHWLFFMTSDAMEYFVFAVIVYLLYFSILKRKQLSYIVSFSLWAIVLITALAMLKSYRISNTILLDKSFDYFTEFIGKTFLLYAIVYFVNRLEFFFRYNTLELELKQTKEQLLRNQLHPHFLFNAFNSLYSMSLKQHPKTSDTILKLSSMMRYLTDESITRTVKLSQELQFITQYVAIEKIRFGTQANIRLHIEGNPIGKQIEPLLLLVLVENAFKHGFYTNDTDAFVHIAVKITDTVLHFTVKNSIQQKQHFNTTDRKGKGLDNLKKRLQLSYPKAYTYEVSLKNNVYLTQLEINLA